jgi:hypothetical protein
MYGEFMIVVKLEMWPKGDPTKARSLGVATISNVGGTTSSGDYEAVLLKSEEYTRGPLRPLEDRIRDPKVSEIWRKGQIYGFDRVKLGPWDLLFRALGGLVSNRNPLLGGRIETFEGTALPVSESEAPQCRGCHLRTITVNHEGYCITCQVLKKSTPPDASPEETLKP